jgi:hypothetical protein
VSPPAERIPLIYVLSTGRSGSTLLDRLLDTHAEVFTVGELQVLPWELRLERAPCGCGEPVRTCSFWQRSLDAVGGPPPGLERFRESHGHGRVIRPRLLADALLGRVGAARREEAHEYAAATARLLTEVRARAAEERGAPIRYLVDASKDLYRLAWLAHSELFDLRVVHLVRDPRAFVSAMLRGMLPRRGSVRFAGRWVVENALAARFCRAALATGASTRLRYEDLATRPGDALARLGEWLDLDPAGFAADGLSRRPSHGVSGGTARWRGDAVRFEERWRQELSGREARTVWALTWPLRGALGYSA